MKLVLVIITAFALLFGCPGTGGDEAPEQAEQPAEPTGPADLTPSAQQNQPEAVEEEEEEVPEEEQVAEEEEPVEEEEEPEPQAEPRSMSDNIADGEFMIADQPAAELKIYVIDAGHADSVLVNKGEFYMLMDAGNFAPVNSFLKAKGIDNLNVVVATRDYSGAINGLESILDAYQVGEFWENGASTASAEYSSEYISLLQAVETKGITVKHPEAGDRLSVSGLDITILNPQTQRLYSNVDTDAIVMKLSNNDFCAVLLHPTIYERENALISSKEDLRCNVATFFKHGEGRPTGSSVLFDSYIKPRDVIISVGENDDELPQPTTITWLGLRDISIWRTDADGTVMVSSDGINPYTISGGN